MGWLAWYPYAETIADRSVTYSSLQRPKGSCTEKAHRPLPGRRITMASMFSRVMGLEKMNFFADHGLESSSVVAATLGPTCTGGGASGCGIAGALCMTAF